MLIGSTAAHFSRCLSEASGSPSDSEETLSGNEDHRVDVDGDAGQGNHAVEGRLGDVGPESGPQSLSSITLAATPGMLSRFTFKIY
jgi:hypothetical protein